MASPRSGSTSPWRMVLDRVLRPGEGPSRVIGILFLFVGWVFAGQALLTCYRAASADTKVDATIEQRYYRMTPYYGPGEAAAALARHSLYTAFHVRSIAVLGFEVPGRGPQHVMFANPREEVALTGTLDWRIPTPWLELRFPPGTLDVMRSLPRDEERDLARPACTWCKTRYDELIDEFDDPERALIMAWTNAPGATVPLEYGAAHPELPLLADGRGAPPFLAVLPALAIGGFFVFFGLITALSRPPPDDDGNAAPAAPRPRSAGEWVWVVFVLATPLWLGAFPSIAGLWGDDAARVLEDLARKPVTALQFFDAVMPEPVDQAPYDSVRALGPESPYLPLWHEFRFERPKDCCDDGEAALKAAADQAAQQLAAFDPERRARVVAMLGELEQQQRFKMSGLLKPGLDRLEAEGASSH